MLLILIGSIIGFSGGGTTIFPVYGWNLYPFGTPLVFFYTVLVSYAITKHRLMDISVIISRSLAEALTTIFYGLIYSGLIWGYRSYISDSIDLAFWAGTILYGILVGQTYQFLRLKVQTTADKVFLRGKYDYYKELSEITTQVTKVLSMENILATLHKAFYDIIEVSNPRIYLTEDFNKPEVQKLLAVKEPAFTDDNLVVPCLLEDRLIALVVLGRKLSEDHYTEEDIRLLKALASQIAVTIAHTRTYEEIKKEYVLEQQAKEKALTRALTAEEIADKAAKEAALLREVALQLQHEVKNPLAAIDLQTRSLPDHWEDKKWREEHVMRVRRSVELISATMDDLGEYGTLKISEKYPVDINELVNEAIFIWQSHFEKAGISVEKNLGKLPLIKANPDSLQRVFLNLCVNAAQAMKEGGVFTVTTYPGQHQAKDQIVDGIIIKIKDTGEGIPKENFEKIFRFKFTTRYEGKGRGLSLGYLIITEGHNGIISFESEVGKGTEFTIALPL